MKNARKKEKKRFLKDIIEKRYTFLIIVIIMIFSLITFKLFSVIILDSESYQEKLLAAVETTVEGSSAPRGRIYDRNYNLLVDNKAIKTIYYKKSKGVTVKEEIELAYKVLSYLTVDYTKLTTSQLKNFWVKLNPDEAKARITDEERKSLSERKITSDDIEKIKLERVTNEDIEKFNEEDRHAAYLYYLMNKGYSYDEKTIKNVDVTEEEYAIISENVSQLDGFNTKLDWVRIYPYGDVFKSILGKVSSDTQGIPAELAEDYVNKGYALNDRVGISYLEYQYEEYLKGTKATYRVLNDNSYELVDAGSRGNDIVLTIDINLQREVENILSYEVMNAKGDVNTEYYDHSFVIVSNPSTGEILAMAGKKVVYDDNNNKKIQDYTPGIVTLPVTAGSIVKGASMSVGYKYGAISIGETMFDECLYIKATPAKCSWRDLGYVNDITALQLSSNVYQFKIALRVGGSEYVVNDAISIDEEAFDKYRSMYLSYGLGEKTGIDLPVESLGYKGTSRLGGHLLDFAIGQYDTYTTIQLSKYMNTLANSGLRVTPYLLKEVYAPSTEKEKLGSKIYNAEVKVEGEVDLEEQYMNRIRQGLNAVMNGILGSGYMGDYSSNAGGKTGTSQSFIDTDGDGNVDTETITSTFGGFAPFDNPVMSIVAVSPNISHEHNGSNYSNSINKRLVSQITHKYFEIFK
ncbi:MAG: penicillin-binding protein 2 [bacterium]|nr:penicillin-binding protein 2 [bacterium]